jgi:hypothetical protein
VRRQQLIPVRFTVMCAVLVLLAGCSTQPTTQDSPATVAAVEKTSGKIPSGYRRETHKGQELYCRRTTTLGSRFAQKLCFTREQLVEMQWRTDSTMGELDRGVRVCGTAEACGGTTPRPTSSPIVQ